MSNDEINIESLLKTIYDNKVSSEKEKKEIEKNLNTISKLKLQIEQDNKRIKTTEKEIIEKAKLEARNILLEAKEELNEIINLKTKSQKELNKKRNLLNTNIKNLSSNKKVINNETLEKKNIYQGLKVFVNTIGKHGVIVSNISKDNEVQVQVGIFKMSVNISDLSPAKEKTSNKKSAVSYANPSKLKNVSSELNIIGMNVEEAILVVDKFLDDATLAHLNSVRIVHGKGTGKLKNGIHTFLRKNAHVKSFRLGTFGEGEMGVTIVELK